MGDFTNQPVNLLLLTVDGHVQLLQQVVGVAGLDLEFGQALVGGVGMGHAAIGQDGAHGAQ